MNDFLRNLFHDQQADPSNFFLVAGPCVVENTTMPSEISLIIKEICQRLGLPFIFKASYRKANRTSAISFSGIGDIPALEAIQLAGRQAGVPTLTDIHSESEAYLAATYTDVLQIPAFLCRQTSLLQAAAKTGKVINIKKGQFVSASTMKYAAEKVLSAGNNQIMLTERGSMFGYNDLVVDFRNIYLMKQTGFPVILDATHSLQKPNTEEGVSGGNPEMIELIASAGIAAGADGIFIETHPTPQTALSDGANMLPLNKLEPLLKKLIRIRKAYLE